MGCEHLPHEKTGFPGGRWWRLRRETSSDGVEDEGVDGDDMQKVSVQCEDRDTDKRTISPFTLRHARSVRWVANSGVPRPRESEFGPAWNRARGTYSGGRAACFRQFSRFRRAAWRFAPLSSATQVCGRCGTGADRESAVLGDLGPLDRRPASSLCARGMWLAGWRPAACRSASLPGHLGGVGARAESGTEASADPSWTRFSDLAASAWGSEHKESGQRTDTARCARPPSHPIRPERAL